MLMTSSLTWRSWGGEPELLLGLGPCEKADFIFQQDTDEILIGLRILHDLVKQEPVCQV